MDFKILAPNTSGGLFRFEEDDIKENEDDDRIPLSCCDYGPFYAIYAVEPVD